jgi:molybdopterin-dependent oxidoreductase alpha subunit
MSDIQPAQPLKIVGGGPKKILYTLKTLGRIGLLNSAKALNSRNTCKACGLGMGGQEGGMANELGEFPSVCNKSVQAQSTDIQPAIPTEIFNHPLADFHELSAKELEHLGRLNTPIYKSAESDRYTPLSWDQALDIMARRFAETLPERSFFYSSGRSSNEAGFVLQLLARLYGTNNVNNCSYYCHQATGVGLSRSIGSGTASVSLADLALADCIFVIGANPASNHPRFIHQLKNCRDRGGQVIVINPAKEPGLVRFAVPKSASSLLSGGTWIASEYVQPKIGGDLALLTGVAKVLLASNSIDEKFITRYTENFSSYRESVESCEWSSIENLSGVTREKIESLARQYAEAKNVVFAWGMGITHHQWGVDNVEAIANLALLRGMLGKSGAGLLPLRGHSNVQGIGSVGVKPQLSEEMLQALEKFSGKPLSRKPGMDTLACLEAADRNEIDAALLMGGNLYAATPNSQWARQALNKIGFKVYLTTTLNRGHINGMETSEALILPVCARDEEPQPTTQESMFNFVRLSDGGIVRLDNLRSEVQILCELGQRLMAQGPLDFSQMKEHREIRRALARMVPGLEALANIDESREEFTIPQRILHQPLFNTPSGKASFVVTSLPSTTTSATEFPYTLASIRSEGQFNSMIYEEEDTYRGTHTRWSVLMNPEDIAELGLESGDYVNLHSAVGQMAGLKIFAFDVPRKNLLAYYPEANVLLDTRRDPRSQTPAFKSVPVAVTAVTAR